VRHRHHGFFVPAMPPDAAGAGGQPAVFHPNIAPKAASISAARSQQVPLRVLPL
jgi:hypothetical protein